MTGAGPALTRRVWSALAVLALLVAAAPVVADPVVADEVEPTVLTPDVVDFDDPLRSLQWYLDRIRAPQAWARTTGDPDVTIAVIDTGIDPRHPDLVGAFWTDPVTGQNGFDHLEGGFPTYRSPDEDWHGTAVAGVAAARAGDGYGIAGVAPDVTVMVRRVYRSLSTDSVPTQTSYAAAIEAMEASVADGADVLLLTWGGTNPNAALLQAIRNAGMPVVVAAGNDGQDLSNDPAIRRYPAMYRTPNLVTVAASNRQNGILDTGQASSNYGVRHVDIAAPGQEIASLVAGGDHAIFNGTSFAAPQVAAALALGRSIAPGASANELVGAVVGTARRTAGLNGRVTSGGLLDVEAFLAAVERPVCTGGYPPSTFEDVSRGSVHAHGIDCVAWYQIALGVDATRYAPSRTITRAEMATFLARVLERAGYEAPAEVLPGADGYEPPFIDIAGTTHERSIALLADAGVVSGVGGGLYDPQRTVTRAQMATFLVQTAEVLLERELTSDQQWFDDTAGSVHAPRIAAARELQITLGASDPRLYDPSAGVTRGQMATFVGRTMDLLGREGVTIPPPS